MQEGQSIRAGVNKLFPVLGVITSLSIAVICGEVLTRLLFTYSTPDTVKEHSLPHASAAYARSVFLPVNREIKIDKSRVFFINRHGYRGSSFEVPKPQELQRIVVLGGSTVFDQNTEEGRDWPHLVEKILKEKGHHKVEVINAGIPGHASSDSLGRLYTHIWQWEPDYVIVSHAWNDFKYMNDISSDSPLISLIKPANPDADPSMTYQGILDYVLAYSQLYVKIRNRYFAWKASLGAEGRMKDDRRDDVGSLGLRQFRLNMELLIDATRNIHAVPIIVTQPTLVSAKNTEEDRKRIGYGSVGLSHEGILRAYEKCRQVILDVARLKNVYVIDLTPQFQGKSDLFSDHDHTTPQGSEEVARRVAEFMDPILKPSSER